jgi:hypothetical protein
VIDVIGDLLPVAMAVAFSPFPLIAIVLVLGSPRASTSGPAFALGWVVGLGAITGAFLALTSGGSGDEGAAGLLSGWGKVALGLALLVLAVKKWRGRPRPGEGAALPSWMATIDDLAPGRAAALGAALGGLNPKNLGLAGAAGATIGSMDLADGDAAAAAAVFVLLGSCTVLAAVIAHAVGGARVEPALEGVKGFLLEHHTAIMVVVLVLIGAKVLGDGMAAV